jgi:hypothetical protein
MIKKFVDENENIFVFMEVEDRIVMWINDKCEYTFKEIVSLPETLEDAYRISSLNIWYPMNEI